MPLQSSQTGTAKIIVAMSGGVDSSVAAALLKKQGFDVTGVFMKFWLGLSTGLVERWNRCCSSDAEKRARAVAKILKMPFYVFNFSKEFKKKIVDDFLKEYQVGRTPNPCVVCNKEIKFGLLLKKALALEADFVATGHYVRIKGDRLLKGKDKDKDQSYFLWQLSQKQLKHILFPVGNYTKPEVRILAKKFKLPFFETPESQEICFVQNTTNEFLARYLKQKPGSIVDLKGKVLGKHRGLAFYTLGQRKGIGLSGGPYFVLKKDLEKNLLIVTKNEKDLEQKELRFKNANWLSPKDPAKAWPTGQAGKIKAKIRYRAKLASGKLVKPNKFVFDKPQCAITPGQSVVFYLGEELLGGGIISNAVF
ncbi:MAG: tRNA 2-thiouridine(34) synthase MnmA [Candidatus Nealsonbacteria bacterium RIFCSPLOWO2_01_FULL_43_32]|uniref:tRNA-specific 2-thiouridylase MnmA n=1 Tax=Candidatus Nealsonbacteria bacterium RIFCSPLOWO2_01_FULL_43_32 TaxID=1801672 RepID=A0A1G2EG84_9BACT|nr:MAG: tRNA 2-thiouridine(34) synthase MnmA [Candidatus Nealsonbacteria bacterium RIFCSPLOWO2_01_FULL_43_32]